MIKAVIFDLDGVIVTTDDCHYEAWKKMADEEGIPFDRTINERLRGVSRQESLEIILEKAERSYSDMEKITLTDRKNSYYCEFIKGLKPTDVMPGVNDVLAELQDKGIKVGIGSSSRNTPIILEQIGMSDRFDAIADGNMIRRSKPDPEVFLLAAEKMEVPADSCLVIEDAEAGVEAALAGGMKVVGVGSAALYDRAHLGVEGLHKVDADHLLSV